VWRLSSHGADYSKTQQKSLSDYEDKEDDDMEKVDNGVVEYATDGFVVPDWNLSDIQVLRYWAHPQSILCKQRSFLQPHTAIEQEFQIHVCASPASFLIM
jgi:hypothetical protein